MTKEFITGRTGIEMTVTSPTNWAKFVDTGNNDLLNDVDIRSVPKGTRAVLASEGIEREIILE